MPRTSRAAAGGVVYHVLHRGNGRMGVFRKPGDYLGLPAAPGLGKRHCWLRINMYAPPPGLRLGYRVIASRFR
jgi:hypothetical protein